MARCQYAESDDTPCVVNDGDKCWAMDWMDKPICVGCGKYPKTIGRAAPADWAQTVEKYYRDHPEAKRHV